MSTYNLSTFFIPNPDILNRLTKIYVQNSIKSARFYRVLSIIFCVFCAFFCCTLFVKTLPNTIAIFCIALCAVFALLCIKKKSAEMAKNTTYYSKTLLIKDGRITKTEAYSDTPGCINAWFESNDGTINNGWYRIRSENAEIGTSAILVVEKNEYAKNRVSRVFTDFMLSDYGVTLHW